MFLNRFRKTYTRKFKSWDHYVKWAKKQAPGSCTSCGSCMIHYKKGRIIAKWCMTACPSNLVGWVRNVRCRGRWYYKRPFIYQLEEIKRRFKSWKND